MTSPKLYRKLKETEILRATDEYRSIVSGDWLRTPRPGELRGAFTYRREVRMVPGYGDLRWLDSGEVLEARHLWFGGEGSKLRPISARNIGSAPPRDSGRPDGFAEYLANTELVNEVGDIFKLTNWLPGQTHEIIEKLGPPAPELESEETRARREKERLRALALQLAPASHGQTCVLCGCLFIRGHVEISLQTGGSAHEFCLRGRR